MSKEQGQGLPPELQERVREANRRAERQAAMDVRGVEVIYRIIGGLDSKMENFPLCERPSLETGWEWHLNGAVLRVDPIRKTDVEIADLKYVGPAPGPTSGILWHEMPGVRAYSAVRFSTPRPSGLEHYTRSLWYCEGGGVARWYTLWFSSPKSPFTKVALSPEEAQSALKEKRYQFCDVLPVDETDFVNRYFVAFVEADSI